MTLAVLILMLWALIGTMAAAAFAKVAGPC
jgi:hypothetical protein